jgi:predicted permease
MSLVKKSFFNGIARIFSLPKLSIPLILTLGLTLGAVLSVIAISSTLLYQPLQGMKNEAQLQTFELNFKPSKVLSISYWNMRRLASFQETFPDLGEWAGISPSDQDVIIDNVIYPTTQYNASNNILDVLGTNLLLGDDVTMASPEKYVWISENLWQYAFAGAKSALGKQLQINNKNYIIAGVIEDVMSVNSNDVILPQQIWFITDLKSTLSEPADVGAIRNELSYLINKSASGAITLPSQEQTEQWLLNYVKTNISEDNLQETLNFMDSMTKVVKSAPYRSNLLGSTEDLIVALFFAVCGLLFMATLNLLNLFIAHYQGRTKEFAIQISLGASLFKVRTLVFLENLSSFLLAAIVGLLVAGWAIKSLPLIAGDSLPMIDEIGINVLTITMSFIIIIFLNILFSALSLVDINKHAIADNLNSSGKGIQAQSNQWLSKVLMVSQLSIASVLLTASVMVALQSYQSVYRDVGYELGNSYEVALFVNDEEWRSQLTADTDNYHDSEMNQLLTNIATLIERKVANSNVIINSTAPLSNEIRLSGYRSEENGGKRITYQSKSLSADYFSTFSIPLLAGANLTQAQIDNDEDRIVIDESMAKALFPDLNYEKIIGKTVALNRGEGAVQPIINGISRNTISRTGITETLSFPAIYSHRIRSSQLYFAVMMPPGQAITPAMLEDELTRQFPRLGNLTIRSLDEIWHEQTLEQRLSMWIVVIMTLLTLFLAAIGVAGLTQMTTNHRKYELAVRMATGAKQMKLIRFILKDTLWMLVIGLGLGFIISVIAYQELEQQLDILPAFNWLAMSSLDIGLIGIVLLSVITPAWRVISADPMQALRQE